MRSTAWFAADSAGGGGGGAAPRAPCSTPGGAPRPPGAAAGRIATAARTGRPPFRRHTLTGLAEEAAVTDDAAPSAPAETGLRWQRSASPA